MELPINMIVVVLIAVLVLTTVGIFLTQQLGGGTGAINYQEAWGKTCTQLRFQYSCNPGLVPVGENGLTFEQLCNKIFPGIDSNVCAKQCGCA